MNRLPLIIKREFFSKVKNRAFFIMTFLTPLIVILGAVLILYLTRLNTEKHKQILVLDESGLFSNTFKDTEYTTYQLLKNNDLSTAKKNAQQEGIYGLLYIPKVSRIDSMASRGISFYSKASPSRLLIEKIEHLVEKRAKHLKIKELGLDATLIKKSNIAISTSLKTFEGEETSKLGEGVKSFFGGATAYLLFMFIVIYGNMVMRSVIEEKTSRIIEIIISSVRPTQLLLGKIVGTSLAGVLQFTIWILLSGVLLSGIVILLGMGDALQGGSVQEATHQLSRQNDIVPIIQEIFKLPLTNLIVMFFLFFIGGYLLYSSLFAAVGAAVDNETDTQQFIIPVMMPLILSVYIGFTVIENPHGVVSQLFSFIPFTSPVVMLMRIPSGVPIWQQMVSLLILFVSFYFVVKIAAKIYRIGILIHGKKPSYKELIRWLRWA